MPLPRLSSNHGTFAVSSPEPTKRVIQDIQQNQYHIIVSILKCNLSKYLTRRPFTRNLASTPSSSPSSSSSSSSSSTTSSAAGGSAYYHFIASCTPSASYCFIIYHGKPRHVSQGDFCAKWHRKRNVPKMSLLQASWGRWWSMPWCVQVSPKHQKIQSQSAIFRRDGNKEVGGNDTLAKTDRYWAVALKHSNLSWQFAYTNRLITAKLQIRGIPHPAYFSDTISCRCPIPVLEYWSKPMLRQSLVFGKPEKELVNVWANGARSLTMKTTNA